MPTVRGGSLNSLRYALQGIDGRLHFVSCPGQRDRENRAWWNFSSIRKTRKHNRENGKTFWTKDAHWAGPIIRDYWPLEQTRLNLGIEKKTASKISYVYVTNSEKDSRNYRICMRRTASWSRLSPRANEKGADRDGYASLIWRFRLVKRIWALTVSWRIQAVGPLMHTRAYTSLASPGIGSDHNCKAFNLMVQLHTIFTVTQHLAFSSSLIFVVGGL